MAFKRELYDDGFSSRTGSRFSIPAIWNTYRGEVLFVLALIVALLLGGYTSHPGLHLAGATVLMDLIAGYRLRHFTISLFVLIVVMNVVGLVFIFSGPDSAELWLSGAYGLYAILLLLARRQKSD